MADFLFDSSIFYRYIPSDPEDKNEEVLKFEALNLNFQFGKLDIFQVYQISDIRQSLKDTGSFLIPIKSTLMTLTEPWTRGGHYNKMAYDEFYSIFLACS